MFKILILVIACEFHEVKMVKFVRSSRRQKGERRKVREKGNKGERETTRGRKEKRKKKREGHVWEKRRRKIKKLMGKVILKK